MLRESKFRPFTHGEIKPRGWLKRQLRIQADGLGGNLDKLWPDIRDSQWIGGDRDGWERVPYWLDGFIPLAWLLEDEDMQRRARRYIDGILSRQEPDGWICPCPPRERKQYDMWAAILIAKVLVMYADLSGDARIEPAVEGILRQFASHIEGATLFNWAAARWFEALIPIFWLYERTGGEWLLELARRLEIQGIDYDKLFASYMDQRPERKWTYLTHVVNLAMCLKQGALKSRLDGGDADLFAEEALAVLERHHGMAVGHFTGDECLAGDSPVQGSELCGVVEAMYAYVVLLSVGGNPRWGDRLERLAFNALPATMSADMWTHQYVQMTNQMRCERLPEEHVVFGTNSAESHLFGLEPNFGCCTANFGQGWPKLAMSAFMLEGKDTLVSTVLVPCEAQTEIDGASVTCRLDTDYPFRDTLSYTISCDVPVTFTLSIRIPEFVAGALVDGETAKPGTFHKIRRQWTGETSIGVTFTFECVLTERPRDMVCLWRGPLLYAIPVKERWERREYAKDGVERRFPYCDYEIFPESPWNYAFAGNAFSVREKPVDEFPFSTEHPALEIMAPMAPIEWHEEYGVCTAEPAGRTPLGEARPVRLIPYGATQLRMTEIPLVTAGDE